MIHGRFIETIFPVVVPLTHGQALYLMRKAEILKDNPDIQWEGRYMIPDQTWFMVHHHDNLVLAVGIKEGEYQLGIIEKDAFKAYLHNNATWDFRDLSVLRYGTRDELAAEILAVMNEKARAAVAKKS